MSRNVVGILGTAIIAVYVIGSGRLVATDTQWYRTLIKPAWQPPGIVVGLIWPYNFALLIIATWVVASPISSPATSLSASTCAPTQPPRPNFTICHNAVLS